MCVGFGGGGVQIEEPEKTKLILNISIRRRGKTLFSDPHRADCCWRMSDKIKIRRCLAHLHFELTYAPTQKLRLPLQRKNVQFNWLFLPPPPPPLFVDNDWANKISFAARLFLCEEIWALIDKPLWLHSKQMDNLCERANALGKKKIGVTLFVVCELSS